MTFFSHNIFLFLNGSGDMGFLHYYENENLFFFVKLILFCSLNKLKKCLMLTIDARSRLSTSNSLDAKDENSVLQNYTFNKKRNKIPIYSELDIAWFKLISSDAKFSLVKKLKKSVNHFLDKCSDHSGCDLLLILSVTCHYQRSSEMCHLQMILHQEDFQ